MSRKYAGSRKKVSLSHQSCGEASYGSAVVDCGPPATVAGHAHSVVCVGTGFGLEEKGTLEYEEGDVSVLYGDPQG